MDKEQFLRKWLPSNRALEEESDEEFIRDVESLCADEFEDGMVSAKETVRDWDDSSDREPRYNEGYE